MSRRLVAAILFAISACAQVPSAFAGDRVLIIPQFPRFYEATDALVSEINIAVLESLAKRARAINVAPFTTTEPGRSRLWCRSSFPIDTAGNAPFDALLHDVLAVELASAGLYDEKAPLTLSGHLEEFDFNSFGQGRWTIRVRFIVPGKTSFVSEKHYEFPIGFGASRACQDVTDAVQAFLAALYADPRFREVIASEENSAPTQKASSNPAAGSQARE